MGGRIRTTATAAILGLGLALGSTLPAAATTLADALALAYKTNPQLRAQQAALRAADENIIAARSVMLPTLNQTVTYSRTIDWTRYSNTTFFPRNPTTTLTLNTALSVRLWDGGVTKNSIESARMNVLAARQALRSLEQQILLLTVQAYMNVRRDQQFVRLAQNNVRVLREQVRAARDRFEVGEVTRTDVSQTEARLAASVSQLEVNRGALQRSINSYIAVVGSAPKDLRAPPPPPKIPSSPEAAEKLALRQHPDLMQAQFNAKSAEFRYIATTGNRNPVITGSLSHTLGGNIGAQNPSTDQLTGSIVGTWSIYQGGKLDSDRRQNLALYQQTLGQVQQTGYTVRQNVNDAFTALRTATAAIRANREAVRAAQVAYEGVLEEAKLGARTTLDSLDAEQELLSARSNLVTSNRDQYVATYQVLAAVGLLTAKHLNLGVDIYDPDINTRDSTRHQLSPFGTRRSNILKKIQKRRGN